MINFWDFNAWGGLSLIAILLASLLMANIIKKAIPLLQASLIPTSVLGGGILNNDIELIFKWGAIVDLLSMPGTRGTYYSLSVWIFIITLAFLDYLFFDNEKLPRFAGDLLIVCIITLIFCGCDLILPAFINSRFLVGFQIGGYFIVRGIYNGPKN